LLPSITHGPKAPAYSADPVPDGAVRRLTVAAGSLPSHESVPEEGWIKGDGPQLRAAASNVARRPAGGIGSDRPDPERQTGRSDDSEYTSARRLGRSMRWNTPDTGCGAGACTVVNRQGTIAATVQADGTIALIDPRAMRLKATLPARNGPAATGLAFLPDGHTLATGGTTGRMTLWDVRTRRVVRTLSFPGSVDDVAVSADGRLLAVQSQAAGSTESRVIVRELASGRTLFTRTVRYGSDGIAFTGRELVAVGCCQPSSTVVAWDVDAGTERFSRMLPAHAVAIDAAPDGSSLAVGTEAGNLLFWDPHTGRDTAPALPVAAGGISQLSFARDSRRIAVGSVDGTATVWNVRERKRIGEPFPISTNLIPAVAFEPSGRLFITELGAVSEWPLDVPSWERFACAVVNRPLTRAEWKDLLPTRPYRRICP
jgi:WD40 repeat protein